MKDIKFNHDEKTIIILKAFEKKAKFYGTKEYKLLVSAKSDYPDYKIKVNSTASKKKTNERKIDYDFILKYIDNSERENKEDIRKNFYAMRGMDANGKKITTTAKAKTFFEVKQWFYKEFAEEIAKDQKLIDDACKTAA